MGVCPTTADADRAPRRSAAYKPVLDDATYRSFDSLAEYRAWCEANLPSWLGYGRAV